MVEEVFAESSGAVRTVTINRPERRNALGATALQALAEIFRATPPPEERVVVIRSVGPVFCSGRDLKEMRDRFGQPPLATASIAEVFEAIERYPLPVVAVVQGDAIAGGNELAMHCDFVVASTKARFGMSLVQLGMAPSWFLTKKLLDVAGPVIAREILLLGDPVPAARLHEAGVIARAVPPEELEQAAAALVDRLAQNAPLPLRAIKQVINREMQFREQIPHDDVDALLREIGRSADAREGISARLERRQPVFRGV
jgi:enoyl-CoA hydratase/carnithine racemase